MNEVSMHMHEIVLNLGQLSWSAKCAMFN